MAKVKRWSYVFLTKTGLEVKQGEFARDKEAIDYAMQLARIHKIDIFCYKAICVASIIDESKDNGK